METPISLLGCHSCHQSCRWVISGGGEYRRHGVFSLDDTGWDEMGLHHYPPKHTRSCDHGSIVENAISSFNPGWLPVSHSPRHPLPLLPCVFDRPLFKASFDCPRSSLPPPSNMVFGVSHNSGDGHLASNSSQLGKIQKRLRLGLFATTYTSRVSERDPTQPTSRKANKAGTVPSSNEPISSPCQSLDSEMDVLLIQPLNISSESPGGPGKSSDGVDDLAQSTPLVFTQPLDPSCQTAIEVRPERGTEGFAVKRKASRLGSLASTKVPSSVASLSAESIALPLHPILTASSNMDSIDAVRKVSLRPSTSHGTADSRSIASKGSKSSSRRVLAETPSLFPINDSFLPRARPPPPLKIPTKHQRNRSLPASASMASAHQPLSQTNPRSKRPEPASFFPVPDVTLPPPLPPFTSTMATKSLALPCRPSTSAGRELSSKTENARLASTSSLTRSSSRVTATSLNTDESQNSSKFALQWTWTPPSSWSGPPPHLSQEGDEGKAKRNKPRVLSRKNSASRMKGSKNTSSPVNVPSVWKPVGTDGLPEEHSVAEETVGREEVVVKMQSFDGDEWTERAVAEVIPKLRTLKSSRF